MTHVLQISPTQDATLPDSALADQLKNLLGAEDVVQESVDRAFFSSDIFTQGIAAELVVSPANEPVFYWPDSRTAYHEPH